FLLMPFAQQLADIPFAPRAHARGARIAQMRIVCPDDCLRTFTLLFQMLHQTIEGLDHMLVSQIPGAWPATIERPVILLGFFGDDCVLRGEEKLVRGETPIAAQ